MRRTGRGNERTHWPLLAGGDFPFLPPGAFIFGCIVVSQITVVLILISIWDWPFLPEEDLPQMAMVLIPPLIVLAFVILAELGLHGRSKESGTRDLDHLVSLKREGGLVARYEDWNTWPPRSDGLLPRTHGSTPPTSVSLDSPEDPLDRLMRWKRQQTR